MIASGKIARALGGALGLGVPAFPCRSDKAPACPRGFKDATSGPEALQDLWQRHPGPLVGMPTGAASGIDVLDLDKKHPEAVEWWSAHRHHLPSTRVHGTRSGGLHLLFTHSPGLRCTAGKIATGIDIRADGGYVIWWPAEGFPVLCDAPTVAWPGWLHDRLNPPPAISGAWVSLANPPGGWRGSRYGDAALRHAADRVARALVGTRNRTLNAEAYGIVRLVAAGLLDIKRVADALAAAAIAAGLAPREIEATLRSAITARGQA